MMRLPGWISQHWAAVRAVLVLTVITGLVYPFAILGIAQIPGLRDKANGSVVEVNGKPVGSTLIGQLFTDADGNPDPASKTDLGSQRRLRARRHRGQQPRAGVH
jgi:K+-transporting ATPase ATPase C chain